MLESAGLAVGDLDVRELRREDDGLRARESKGKGEGVRVNEGGGKARAKESAPRRQHRRTRNIFAYADRVTVAVSCIWMDSIVRI